MKYIAIILIILILTVSITVPLQYYMSDTQNVLRVIKKYSINEKTKEEFRQLCKLDPTDKINVFKENVNDIEINVDDYVSSMFNTFHNVSEDDIAVLLAIYKKVQEPLFIGNASNFIEDAFYNSTNVGDETYDKPGSALVKKRALNMRKTKTTQLGGIEPRLTANLIHVSL